MSFINIFTAILGITEEAVIKYFKRNKALSSETAIDIDFEDFKQGIDAPELIDNKFSEFTYIKKTKSGKFYLDESLLKSETKLVTRILLVIFGILVLVILIPVFLFVITLLIK